MKLSCCLIIRNESATLERCLASIRPHVDELCVLDTGSADDSPVIAKRYADKWEQWTGCNDSDGRIADFSAARNRNMAQATGEALLWLDGDDELVGGSELRKAIVEAPRGPGGAFSILAAYEYDRDAAGRVTTLQWRERVVAPASGFEWRGPVHEGLLGKAGCEPAHSQTDKFRVVHRRTEAHKPVEQGRNLRILRAWFEKHGEADVRLMHYFGAELLSAHQIGEAMYWLRRHAQMSPWSDERCLSLLHLARVHLAMGDGTEAARYATEAMTTKSWPEPLWLMGQAYCMLSEQGVDRDHNLRRGAHFLESGMRFGDAPTLLMTDPTQRFEACHWLSVALAKLGKADEALSWAEKGTAGAPQHAEMASNVREWKAERARQQIRSSAVELHQLGQLEKAGGMAIEAALRGEVRMERATVLPRPGVAAASLVHAQKAAGSTPADASKLRIAFWLGHQLEPWTPETLERNGMGGSETMAWEMSKRLAKMGHDVMVYGHCDTAAVHEGVTWTDASQFGMVEAAGGTDVLIVSRQHAAATLPHSAKVRILWVHDVHVGQDFTPHIAAKYDLIWCLSKWHREFFLQTYPWCPPGKVEVTRNGIDLARFDRSDVVRNPHRAIYSSSPDRGLAEAVKSWPAVRKLVPDAELHCFYGWENWEKSLELGGENGIPHCSRAALEELKALVASTLGVVMHGRVNGKHLAEEMLKSGVWYYPTWFSETSCITAMEAQAARLWCVCPPLAALAETVPDGLALRAYTDNESHSLPEIVALSMKAGTPDVGDRGRFSLDTLAADWDKRIRKLLDDVVPAFSEAAQ